MKNFNANIAIISINANFQRKNYHKICKKIKESNIYACFVYL